MDHAEIVGWLREIDSRRLESLWAAADRVRAESVGPEIHLRGLLEISNTCRRNCHYCGLRAGNPKIHRYRLSEDEILAAVDAAVGFGYGTVVMQSGEDPAVTAETLERVIRKIKACHADLAVTLSVGERTEAELTRWHRAGADRYLLRFETSNRALYRWIHPDRPEEAAQGRPSDRMALLRMIRRIGYELGSGVMIGIPGQTYDDLARDIECFAELDLDMIGVGPYLPHPDTPLAAEVSDEPSEDQVPADDLTTYKVIALARLVCPKANIPATTALSARFGEEARRLGLERGANVIMPNVTPKRFRSDYEIYLEKGAVVETAEAVDRSIRRLVDSIGRTIGRGRGDSPRFLER